MSGNKATVALLVMLTLIASVAVIARFDGSIFTLPGPPVPTMVYDTTVPSADEKVVCIVFDDGWKSQLDAVPILESFNFNATFAIVTTYTSYPAYMNWADIAGLAKGGMDIASHTNTHADLSAVDSATLDRELAKSQQVFAPKVTLLTFLSIPTVTQLTTRRFAMQSPSITCWQGAQTKANVTYQAATGTASNHMTFTTTLPWVILLHT